MKKRHIYISILFFLFHLLTIQAQRNRGDFRIFDGEIDVLSGLNDCCNTESVDDFSFGWNNNNALFIALENDRLLKKAYNDRLTAWFNRQKNEVIKPAIEQKLGQTFSNFEEAKNALFIKSELNNISTNVIQPRNKYGTLRSSGFQKQNTYLRELKLLSLRKIEINNGNINNPQFGNIKINNVFLKDIHNMSELNTLWDNRYTTFGTNNAQTHINKYVYEKLLNLGGSFNDFVVNLKNQYYNSYSSVWDKLNFMQFLLNYEEYKRYNTPPYVLSQEIQALFDKFNEMDKATSPVIENYAITHRGGGISIFDPDYPSSIAYQYYSLFANDWEGQYEALDYAEYIADQEREDALNNILNNVSLENEIKVQSVISTLGYGVNSSEAIWLNAHIGQGVQIFDFLGNNPTLEEIEFGNLATAAWMNNINSEIDFDDQIINNLTGKADCTYGKLQNNTLLKKTLERFVGVGTPVHLILEQKSNLREDDTNPNSPLVNGKTYYGLSYYVTIKLNTEQANNRPSLAVARTILHEAIHAEIFRKMKTTSGLLYRPNMIPHYVMPNGSRPNFPTLFDTYNDYPNNPNHNFMANYYRDAIVNGLKEYAQSIGETHTDQFYKDMAWSGLLDTQAWNNQYADPVYAASEKTRIQNVINNYDNSHNNECQ